MQGCSEIDPYQGEFEFILTTFDTQVSTETSSRLVLTSRFTFHFSALRHLSYYIFRLFIPILLIITVSYITFFLMDYSRRIEIATIATCFCTSPSASAWEKITQAWAT